jgi:hypothetical protein
MILTAVCLAMTNIGCGKDNASESQPSGTKAIVSQIQNNQPPVPPVVEGYVSNFDKVNYPVSNTIDGDASTFMVTPELSKGVIKYISFKLKTATHLSYVTLVDDYTNEFNLGHLEVQVSGDSIDGISGQWETVETVDKELSGFVDGDGTIQINRANVKWVRLKMTYNGTGAYGASPSFYLSEISFH